MFILFVIRQPRRGLEMDQFLSAVSNGGMCGVVEKPTEVSQSTKTSEITEIWPHTPPTSVSCVQKVSTMMASNDGSSDSLSFSKTPNSTVSGPGSMEPASDIAEAAIAEPRKDKEKISNRSKQVTKSARGSSDHVPHARLNKPPRKCTNCGTMETSVWRRSDFGEVQCNACKLFFRKHGRTRPVSMRNDKIAPKCRLMRCEMCSVKIKENAANILPLDKACTRHHQNAIDTSPEAIITQNCIVEFPDLRQLRSSLAQNIFVPSDHFMDVPHTAVNVEEQLKPSGRVGQIRSSRRSQLLRSSPTDVFGHEIPQSAVNLNDSVFEHEVLEGSFNLPSHLSNGLQSFSENLEKHLAKGDAISRDQVNSQHAGPYTELH